MFTDVWTHFSRIRISFYHDAFSIFCFSSSCFCFLNSTIKPWQGLSHYSQSCFQRSVCLQFIQDGCYIFPQDDLNFYFCSFLMPVMILSQIWTVPYQSSSISCRKFSFAPTMVLARQLTLHKWVVWDEMRCLGELGMILSPFLLKLGPLYGLIHMLAHKHVVPDPDFLTTP